MKRAVTSLILIFYLFSALGIDMNIHFCGGKFDSIVFASRDNEGCKCSGNFEFNLPGIYKKVKSCCKDVHIHCAFGTSYFSENEFSNGEAFAIEKVLAYHFPFSFERVEFSSYKFNGGFFNSKYRHTRRARHTWPQTFVELNVYRL